jgi:hypothetical protein
VSIGGIARLVAEDDVVVAIRVEGRVEVDQVDGGIGQIATQDVEVVAVVEDVVARSVIFAIPFAPRSKIVVPPFGPSCGERWNR